jgi:hypothetical protein
MLQPCLTCSAVASAAAAAAVGAVRVLSSALGVATSTAGSK